MLRETDARASGWSRCTAATRARWTRTSGNTVARSICDDAASPPRDTPRRRRTSRSRPPKFGFAYPSIDANRRRRRPSHTETRARVRRADRRPEDRDRSEDGYSAYGIQSRGSRPRAESNRFRIGAARRRPRRRRRARRESRDTETEYPYPRDRSRRISRRRHCRSPSTPLWSPRDPRACTGDSASGSRGARRDRSGNAQTRRRRETRESIPDPSRRIRREFQKRFCETRRRRVRARAARRPSSGRPRGAP